MSPRVACKNKWARIEALQRNKAFIEQHRDARNEKLAGRDVIFPAGTWWLHRFAGVKRADPEAGPPSPGPVCRLPLSVLPCFGRVNIGAGISSRTKMSGSCRATNRRPEINDQGKCD
jgi:hypothetical protein